MTRNVLITGVGRIGAGLAAGLAADGWDLALSYWTPYDVRIGLAGEPDDPERLAEELREQGRRVELLPADLADPSVPEDLVRQAAARLGPFRSAARARDQDGDRAGDEAAHLRSLPADRASATTMP